MSTYGSHPEQMTVKLTLGDGAHLVATSANGWAGPVSLVWGPDDGQWTEETSTLTDVGTVDGTEVSWTLTIAEVTARAAFPYVRLVDNGMTLKAGEVIPWTGGLGSTVTQTIASLTAGPPGPSAVSADADNVAIISPNDGLIYVSPADAGGFSDAAVAAFVDDTGSSTYASILAGFAATDDPRLSDARTPTAHTHDDRYFTEAEVTSALALKSDTGHGHVINDITGLQSALDGKQAAGSYAAASHTHGVTDLTATGTKDATTFLRGDNTWAVPAGGGGGVTDHGDLTGLADDDHTQYALADGSRGSFAAPLGPDDNYVTDAEKAALHSHSNKAALDLVSGTNTGDQVLPTWSTISGKPAVVAAGATQADARTAIGAGTSSFSGDYDDLTGKPTLGDAAAKNTGTTAGTVAAGDDSRITGAAQKSANLSDLADAGTARTNLGLGTAATTAASAYATAAQGALADTALQVATAQPINAQTGTTYTLQASDAGKVVTLTNAGAITLTVPSGTFSAGQRVDIAQRGAGAVTVVGSGVTVNAPPGGSLVTEGQYAYASIFFISSTVADVVGLMAAP